MFSDGNILSVNILVSMEITMESDHKEQCGIFQAGCHSKTIALTI